jgi:uncharacterized protein
LSPHYPAQVAIDGYGAAGFVFAGMAHRGAILALPSGIHAWDGQSFAAVFAERALIDLLLIGTGPSLLRPSRPALAALAEAGLAADAMATPSAIATYNLLLGERRRVAAALLPATP